MKPSLPAVLSFTGGYVDAAAFLGLHGLFVAHVTGNFVTLGAAAATGSGTIPKLIALPVFCAAVVALRYMSLVLPAAPRRALLWMLTAQLVFLTAGAVLAVRAGPFSDPDGLALIVTGMLLVIGMAIQNTAHRIHLGSAPSSTAMTTTITELMVDVADLLRGGESALQAPARARLGRLGAAVVSFAFGCGLAAILYIHDRTWCFAMLPLLALAGIAVAASGKEPHGPEPSGGGIAQQSGAPG